MKSTLSKKKNFVLLMLLLLIISITACGTKDKDSDTVANTSQNETENVSTGSDGEGSDKEDLEADADFDARLTAYKSALEDFYYNHTFPDSQPLNWSEDNSYGGMENNKFAIYDIDKDNQDELILLYSTASMAGMVELIYDFDSDNKTLYEEFREFPALTYYDNGIVKADWSHNQGLAGDFWPYSLYQYDSESDRYVNIGMVDAWDKSLLEMDNDGNPFPTEIDVDDDGIIYYIMEDGEYKRENPVDGSEYEQWINSYISDANEVVIPFEDITEENITNLQ